MGVSIIIVVATCIVSFLAFSNQRLVSDLIFIPLLLPSKTMVPFFRAG